MAAKKVKNPLKENPKVMNALRSEFGDHIANEICMKEVYHQALISGAKSQTIKGVSL